MEWKANHLRLFISHVNANMQLAGILKLQLAWYGVDAFVAHADIKPTDEWQVEIENALKSMDALVALLFQGFQQSDWTDQEVGFGLGRERLVFAVRYDLNPYGFLAKLQCIQGVGRTEHQLADDIFNVLASNSKTSVQASRGAVEALYQANSFQEAKNCISYVERCSTFSPDAPMRLQAALHDNGQVAAAFGVPERIAAVIAQHGGQVP